jgi:1,4-dihydroxy-2-naphthoate polyprenyltransferase
MRLAAVRAFVKLGRPLFLGGGLVLYALGGAVAAFTGHPIDVGRYLVGQLAVTAFQLMTHYANEYFDFAADCANTTPTRWSGGSRVLVAGDLPREVALVAALVLALAGISISVWLAFAGAGALTLPVLVAILVLAWSYSAPPARLCARGAGELATAVVVTLLVPVLAFYLQAPDLAGARVLLAAVIPPALLQFAMLLAIELPDAAGDAATGKRTLVVRLGAVRAVHLYIATTALAFLWLPVGMTLGLPAGVALAAALPAPVALWRIARITADHRDPSRFERMTFFAVFLLVATSAAELVAFL